MAGPVVNPPKKSKWSWFTRFQYDEEIDKPGDTRNVLLVVAALITAVTFQAGVNPPGGVWQDTVVTGNNTHTAGRAIYASQKVPFTVFLISNTVGLSSSILIIGFLTHRFPFHFEVVVALISMIVTYGSAVFAVTPNSFVVTPNSKESNESAVNFRYILFFVFLPIVLRFLFQLSRRFKHFVRSLLSC